MCWATTTTSWTKTLGVGERDLPLADPVDALDDATLSQLEIEGDLLFG